jgi:mono/diheme cytochrome c family protein
LRAPEASFTAEFVHVPDSIAVSAQSAYNSSQNSLNRKMLVSAASAEEGVMLKSSLLFFVAAVLVVACLPIVGRNPQAASPALVAAQDSAPVPTPSGKNPVKPTAESQARAKRLYDRDCALCHGDNGNGKNTLDFIIEDWTNPGTLANKPDSDLFATIRNGKDKMPAEEAGRANDTEVWNLIIFIRSFSKNHAPGPAPAAVPAPGATPAPPPADTPVPAPPSTN